MMPLIKIRLLASDILSKIYFYFAQNIYLISICREILMEVIPDLEQREDFENIYFQEDGAPVHTHQ